MEPSMFEHFMVVVLCGIFFMLGRCYEEGWGGLTVRGDDIGG